jgi:hypothetical protein
VELVEPVEQSVLEALEASGPVPPAAAAAEDEAGTAAIAAGTAAIAAGTAGLPLVVVVLLLRVLVPRLGVVARRSRSHLPLLVLNLPALALGVEGSVNQLVEVVEAVVHERVLQMVIQPLPEALLFIAIIGDLSGGIASELEETIMVLSHRHSSLLERKELLVLHLHHSSRDVVVPETLPELDPSEGVAVSSWVGLPPIES